MSDPASKTTEANPNHHTWDAVNRHCLLCGIPMMDSELDAECPEQGGVQKENTSGQTTELRLILAMAPSYQGGHSKIGCEVADYLGVPFPLDAER